MPIATIVFMACWLSLAILGGGGLVYVWQLLLTRHEDRQARKEKVLQQSGASNG